MTAPDAPVHRLEVLGPADRRMLLEGFNATARPAPATTLPELFQAQAARTPWAVALIHEDQELCYGELNARANRLARYLIGLGVGPETLVGVCLDRSVEMVVGILAILKAGGAYVPLDPAYPPTRLAHVLSDAAPDLVLSTAALRGRLSAASAVLALDTPETRAAVAQTPEHDPTDRERTGPLRPRHPAYVIYTSGSSGAPKGVIIEHQSTVNLAAWAASTFSADDWAGVLASTSICFDLSVFELLVTLVQGGAVILAQSALELLTLAAQDRVRLINTVPSAAGSLRDADCLPTGVRTINLAGEALRKALVQGLYRSPHIECVYNLYGPSETTTYSTFTRCGRGASEEPTIGSPIWNTRVYVLDAWLEPAPLGVAGELYIAGAGLARGYLNRPGLTAERFVADPYNPEPGSRMYRTGDRALWRADGTLVFLGRTDEQVKIRGFRIELGEIESTLARHPAVAQAVVTAREDGPGGKYLVAYVVPASGVECDATVLRRHVEALLPGYMAPAAFVVMEALPLTPSGKVDRQALPPPQRERETYRAPRTREEEILRDLFAELLAMPRVGIDDDFFSLGGNSLLAMRLVSLARGGLGVELAIRAVFEAPTVAELAAGLRGSQAARAPLVRQPRPQRLPLSHAQARLWFLHRLEGPGSTYNLPMTYALDGELDVTALEAALADVTARHESLRTTFHEQDGAPFQRILPAAEARPTLVSEGVAESALAACMAAAAATAFDLSREIPLRAWLFQIEPRRHVLLLLLHHIAGDGWSMGPLARDLAEAYAARRRGQKPAWTELPVQYADYTLWQRGHLGEEADPDSLLARQLGFWRGAMAGAPEELDLPYDRPRPSTASSRGATVPVRIDANIHLRLLELARASRASLFMVLQAGLAALLSRLGAGHDVPIGSPIAGRGEQALDDLVGFFVNTLVLRTDLSGDPSFRELVARVRAFDLEAYNHQDVPFERVVEALRPARSPARHPLFQVMLVLRNEPDAQLTLPGVTVQPAPLAEFTAKFDLTLDLGELRGPGGAPLGIEGELVYSRDLFDEETALAMGARFARLLEAAAAEPDASVHRLEVLGPADRRMLLEGFNATARPTPATTLPELFQAQAARTPWAVALIHEDQELCYGELNARANRLARYLMGLGVGPETLVGVCLDRSVEMVVGVLAILKAGGVYVPLDPDYPQERLGFMIRDTRAPVLLTQARGRYQLPEHEARIVDLDRDWDAVAQESPENLATEMGPDHLAYVMYTSGSTGRPKGVAVTHRAIIRLLFGVDYARLDASTTLLQMSPISFDASTFELWGALLHGGRCVLLPGRVPTPDVLGVLIERHGIDTLWLTAALFNVVVDEAPESIAPLEQLLIGGEALSVRHVRRFQAACPRTRLINGYGPTEGTTFSCCHDIPGDFDGASVPIGRPIWNTRVYVLDAWLEPAPLGVAGELYIAGAGLARGYLNRPGLTAERFVADPYNPEPGSRMYRTGDRALWRADGRLVFLGRTDEQVKIRGFRIELGEIESTLARHPAVAQAVVTAREDGPGGKHLVAYVVPASGVECDATVLRRHVEALLPGYMAPAAFVVMEALPLTPSGKIDRRALPPPQRPSETYRPPRTPEEESLCRLFAEVLAQERVSIDDDFFELGGHSLLVVRLSHEIAKTFQQNLPLSLIYRHSTVERMAPLLRKWAAAEPAASHPLATARAANRAIPFFCLSEAPLLAKQLDDVPVCSLGFRPDDLRDYVSIEEVARVNAERIREHQKEGPYQLSGFCGMAVVAFEVARRLHQQGQEVSLLVLLDPPSIGSFDRRRSSRLRFYGGRILHHLAVVAMLHPRSWPEYCLSRASTIRRSLVARFMGITNRPPDSVNVSTPMLEALMAYTPEVYPGRATLFVSSENLVDSAPKFDLGWGAVTGGGVEVRVVPGGHLTMFEEPNLGILAQGLKDMLVRETQPRNPEPGALPRRRFKWFSRLPSFAAVLPQPLIGENP